MLWCCSASCWYTELEESRLSTKVVGKPPLGLELGWGAAEVDGAAGGGAGVDEDATDGTTDDTRGAATLFSATTGGLTGAC